MPFHQEITITDESGVMVDNKFILGCKPDNRNGSRLLVIAQLKLPIWLDGEERKGARQGESISARPIGSGKKGKVVYIGDDEYIVTRLTSTQDPISRSSLERLQLEATHEFKFVRVVPGADYIKVLEKAIKRSP